MATESVPHRHQANQSNPPKRLKLLNLSIHTNHRIQCDLRRLQLSLISPPIPVVPRTRITPPTVLLHRRHRRHQPLSGARSSKSERSLVLFTALSRSSCLIGAKTSVLYKPKFVLSRQKRKPSSWRGRSRRSIATATVMSNMSSKKNDDLRVKSNMLSKRSDVLLEKSNISLKRSDDLYAKLSTL